MNEQHPTIIIGWLTQSLHYLTNAPDFSNLTKAKYHLLKAKEYMEAYEKELSEEYCATEVKC